MNHTPTPWKVSDTSIVTEEICIAVIEDDGGYEAGIEERAANAEFIVLACNSHDTLVYACKSLLREAKQIRDIRAAGWPVEAVELARKAMAALKGAK